MITNNLNLQFKGFSPSEFTERYLHGKFGLLLEEAPYGSVLKVTYRKENEGYKGLLVICAKRGKKFVSFGFGDNLKAVTQEMMEKIKQQLSSWKARRFNDEVSYGETSLA